MLPFSKPPKISGPLHSAFRAFARNEDGALTIFGLLLLIMMMVAGGFALDMMRSEAHRAQVQYTIDRAVLAAAALDQEQDGTTVVRDYLSAAGIDPDSVRITSTDTGTAKTVSVTGISQVDSLFLGMVGQETLEFPVSSQAREEEVELEVSLVMDISGSMGGTKNRNLRTAASDFVAELLAGREELTSISLVPYNDRVNLGATLAGYLPMSNEHSMSHCVVFSDAEFRTTGIEAGTVLQRMGHFDKNTGNRNRPGEVEDPNCELTNYGAVTPWSNNITNLQTAIQGLGAGDWTAMDLGVKVGALMLDPSLRAPMADMISDGLVSADLGGRPFDYGTEGVRKVLVVMTDGVNTTQWDLLDALKDGPSGVFVYRAGLTAPSSVGGSIGGNDDDDDDDDDDDGVDWNNGNTDNGNAWWKQEARHNWIGYDADLNGDGNASETETFYSIWSDTFDAYWVSHLDAYYSEPFGGSDAIELSYAEVFAALPTNYIDSTLLSGADRATRNKFDDAWTVIANQRIADDNLDDICSAARTAGITIYTIAFQAPSSGVTAMRDCAGPGNAANFFDVATLDIDSAFDDILASINRLKLTE
ncbi:TadE/TadG family type IV pilus assembly protein [Jannaschia sp. 2305UL9-9]|uniref:TadE/TadG family type IV pilus assembly protein n=1 Tax=Jannaschia sp. 2305UL9-9 TaxID=3121638 RepID=UPI0035275FAF